MGRICSWHAAFSHLFLIFVSLYCHRVERNTPGGVSGDCFFYLLAVLLLSPAAGLPCCSQDQAFPVPSSLSFPSFFVFKLLGSVEKEMLQVLHSQTFLWVMQSMSV